MSVMSEKFRMLCENTTVIHNLVREVRSSELDLKYEGTNQVGKKE